MFCVTWSYLQVIYVDMISTLKGLGPILYVNFTHLKTLPNHSCNRFVSIYIIHIIRYTYGTIPTCTIRVWGKDGEHKRKFTLGRKICQVRHIWPTDYYAMAPHWYKIQIMGRLQLKCCNYYEDLCILYKS